MSVVSDLLNLVAGTKKSLDAVRGKFAGSGSIVAAYRTRAEAQNVVNDSSVRSKSKSLVARGNGLITEYNGLYDSVADSGVKLDAAANDLKTNPVYSLASDPNAGTRVLDLYKQGVAKTNALVSSSRNLVVSVNKYLSDVDKYVDDVESLEQFAQGKGLEATLSGVAQGTTGVLKSGFQTVAVVGILGLFLVVYANRRPTTR